MGDLDLFGCKYSTLGYTGLVMSYYAVFQTYFQRNGVLHCSLHAVNMRITVSESYSGTFQSSTCKEIRIAFSRSRCPRGFHPEFVNENVLNELHSAEACSSNVQYEEPNCSLCIQINK